MCGICGAFALDRRPGPVIDPEVLDRMTDAMTHRGPNDRGTHLEERAALGVRRLSIVDVAGGHQPVANEDGRVWAVQNGELYNHASIHRELERQGHRFESRCDTEILPHLYERDGTAFVERLRGKFGLAVWDARAGRGVLARDRLGVKPLYYALAGDRLLFASELKSLLASGLIEPELDYEALEVFLTLGFFVGPRTPLAGVSKLLPGHLLVVEDGAVRTERYWEYPLPVPLGSGPPLAEQADGLLAELDEAVRLRLMSDVPIGAILSGGLDSSLVVALMARNSAEPVKTFSVAFREDEANELADARLVAGLFGTEHHELELSYAEDAVELEDLVWSMDEPLADLSSLGYLALSELTSRHVTVALSGQGADELFGGYLKHKAAAICRRWDRLPLPARRAFGAVLPLMPGPARRASRTLAATDHSDRLIAMSGKLGPGLREDLLRGPLLESDGLATRRAIEPLAGLPPGTDALAATLHIDAQLALVDRMLHYFDRGAMAHSLEVRVPFLDHRVVEFCARIPSDLKVRRLTTKYVLREAARRVLPDRIVDKRKVGFFADATAGWLQSQVDRSLTDYLLDPAPAYAGFLDRGAIERLVRTREAGRGVRERDLLLAILMLEVWLSTYLPRALPPAGRAAAAA
jgi:asparagine synthase (glutamine-hydrolysing)